MKLSELIEELQDLNEDIKDKEIISINFFSSTYVDLQETANPINIGDKYQGFILTKTY